MSKSALLKPALFNCFLEKRFWTLKQAEIKSHYGKVDFDYALVYSIAETWNEVRVSAKLQAAA